MQSPTVLDPRLTKKIVARPRDARAEAPSPCRSRRSTVVVTIEYCVPGNARWRADELASVLRDRFGAEVTCHPSRGGAFEVTVAGRLIFSKRANLRFPDIDEIVYHVEQARVAIG